ncbi:hypothetical protein PG993_011144 [Apiospora rasikravindrae]|uniref:Uncharacterized protein n=1 Tax=Apiospora rasikravindrae TaxID=990691 RepID=A0ABR1SDI3_9PEZI
MKSTSLARYIQADGIDGRGTAPCASSGDETPMEQSGDQKRRSCSGPGWNSVHRVKEHLYRKHTQPSTVCPCKHSLENGAEFHRDKQSKLVCSERRKIKEEDRVDAAKERQLRSRKMVDNQGLENGPINLNLEERRWYMVYQILFPHDPLDRAPSPYHDGSACQSSVSGDAARRLGVDLPPHVQGQLASMTHDLAKDIAELYISAREFGDLQELEPRTRKRSCEFTKNVLAMLNNDREPCNRGSPEFMESMDSSEVYGSIKSSDTTSQASGMPYIGNDPFAFDPVANFPPGTMIPMNSNLSPYYDVGHLPLDCYMGGSNFMLPHLPEDMYQMDIQ